VGCDGVGGAGNAGVFLAEEVVLSGGEYNLQSAPPFSVIPGAASEIISFPFLLVFHQKNPIFAKYSLISITPTTKRPI
jgi:hypothetical protein